MDKFISKILVMLINVIPISIRRKFRSTKIQEIIGDFIQKTDGELLYQKTWATHHKNLIELRHLWKNNYELKKILKIIHIGKESKVLDVGCGIMTVLHLLPGKLFGVDSLADEYKKIYRYPRKMKVTQGVGELLPYPKKYFDAVFCTNALDHMENTKKAISEIFRVLKKNRYLVIVVDIFFDKTYRNATHPNSFTEKDLTNLLKRKFKIILTKNVIRVSDGDNYSAILMCCRKI
jgi:ubiquinone/menaquinone biosynthesis C-methylase UbiE